MTDKELRKLKKNELMQLLYEQQLRIEELEEALKKAESELNDKRVRIAESGSIAEAALKLTEIFEEAQKAADIYLSSIRDTEREVKEEKKEEGEKETEVLSRLLRNPGLYEK